MKIKPELVPQNLAKMFTEGKEYEVLNPGDRRVDWRVVNDKGNASYTQAENPIINGLVWEVVKADFDITKHEWSDGSDIAAWGSLPKGLKIVYGRRESCDIMYLHKTDAIAIARHFKLTEGDLK